MRWVVVVAILFGAAGARAQDVEPAPAPEATTAKSAQAGMFLPLTLAPRVDSQQAFVTALSAYDGARN